MQVVVMVATIAIHGRNYDSKVEVDCLVNVQCSCDHGLDHGKFMFKIMQHSRDHSRTTVATMILFWNLVFDIL